MMIERVSLQDGQVDSVITLDEALDKLVPAYYMDRDVAAQALRDSQPLRTTAFEYRSAEDISTN